MQLIVFLGLIAKLALVSGDCDVGKTVHNFDIYKVSFGMIKGFLYLAVTAPALCYYFQFVVC